MEPITQATYKKVSKPFKTYQVLLPVILGLFVIGWLFIDEFNPAVFSTFHFSVVSSMFILLAFLLMMMRDFGMIWRFRMVTDNQLSWKQAFHINVLSEFTTAVTPAAVGGSSLVVIFLIKEGIEAGRSTTIMFLNLFLDELFFIVLCPILFLCLPIHELFNSSSVIVSSFAIVFSTLYFLRLIWTGVLFVGIFKQPQWIKKIMILVFRIPFLRRWRIQAESLSESLIQASEDIGKRPFGFWIKIFGTTLLTWIARFLVVNAIFLAFIPISNHLVVFARQLVLWVVMMVSPTPGGSGVSEYAFKEYYSDIFSSKYSDSAIIFVTLIWRMISYYLYLLLGVMVIPKWIRKSFSRNHPVLEDTKASE